MHACTFNFNREGKKEGRGRELRTRPCGVPKEAPAEERRPRRMSMDTGLSRKGAGAFALADGD